MNDMIFNHDIYGFCARQRGMDQGYLNQMSAGLAALQQQAIKQSLIDPTCPLNNVNFALLYPDETDKEREARKLLEAKVRIEKECITMPPSVLPHNWKPLSRWEMFKLNIGLMLIRFGEGNE